VYGWRVDTGALAVLGWVLSLVPMLAFHLHPFPTALQNLLAVLPTTIESSKSSSSAMLQARNAVKMLVTIVSWVSVAAESDAAKATKHITVSPAWRETSYFVVSFQSDSAGATVHGVGALCGP
jgi:hypothetical protein